MTRESYLREKILEHGTVKEFAEKIDKCRYARRNRGRNDYS